MPDSSAKQIPLGDEKRQFMRRRELYASEGVEVTLVDGGLRLAGKVIDMTPEGLGVFTTDALSPKDFLSGNLVDFEMFIHGNDPIEGQVMVAYCKPETLAGVEGTRLGLSFCGGGKGLGLSKKRSVRAGNRFSTPECFRPVAYCRDPIFFNEHLFFQVEDCGANGMRLSTSLRNKSVIPGVTLDLAVNVPMAREFVVKSRVVYAKKSAGEGRYQVGVEFLDKDFVFLEAVSEFLFATSNCSVMDLRRAKFPVHATEKGLSFFAPADDRDWHDVLELRLKAYHSAGKFKDVSDPREMVDEFDAFARQVMCRYHGKVIASGRVVFVNGDPSRSEHMSLGVEIPDWLWNEPFVEFSRACVDSNYRGGDVFANLLRQFGKITYESGCRYVLANCNDNMWPLYKGTGFKKTGVSFDAYGVKNCHLIYVDIRDMFEGKTGSFTVWNQVVYPIAAFASKKSDRPFLSRARLAWHGVLYRALRSLQRHKAIKSTRKRVLRKKTH